MFRCLSSRGSAGLQDALYAHVADLATFGYDPLADVHLERVAGPQRRPTLQRPSLHKRPGLLVRRPSRLNCYGAIGYQRTSMLDPWGWLSSSASRRSPGPSSALSSQQPRGSSSSANEGDGDHQCARRCGGHCFCQFLRAVYCPADYPGPPRQGNLGDAGVRLSSGALLPVANSTRVACVRHPNPVDHPMALSVAQFRRPRELQDIGCAIKLGRLAS
jgi:hypothetical protein